jgi:glucosylceramidase
MKWGNGFTIRAGTLFAISLFVSEASPSDYFVTEAYLSQELASDRIVTQNFNPEPAFISKAPKITSPALLFVEPEKLKHTIWGFGGAITESCLNNLAQAPMTTQKQFRDLLFDREQGAGLSMIRIPVGGHDFSNGDYSLNDLGPGETDPLLMRMNYDSLYPIVEWLKPVQAQVPELKLMITPWTPPAWMKDNDHLRGGQLNKIYFPTFANYLLNAIQFFEREGISIHYLSALNEPLIEEAKSTWHYPQAYMNLDHQWEFANEHLLPRLRSKSLRTGKTTELLLHDHNWGNAAGTAEKFQSLFEKEQTGIAGLATHCYSGNLQTQTDFHERWPDLATMNSECTANIYSTADEFDFQWWLENQTVDSTQLGSRGALAWNLCLDENGGPHNDGCDNCRGVITINSKTHQLKLNPEYYALAQVARVIRPGAKVVQHHISGATTVRALTAMNEDHSLVVVLRNPATEPESLRLQIAPNSHSNVFEVPAKSAMTLQMQRSSSGRY